MSNPPPGNPAPHNPTPGTRASHNPPPGTRAPGNPIPGTRAPHNPPPHNRAGGNPAPLYARLLRLRHIHPGALLCGLYFEGAIAVGALAALAEFASWWGMLVLPVLVALLVKLEDEVSGLRVRARAAVPGDALIPPPRGTRR